MGHDDEAEAAVAVGVGIGSVYAFLSAARRKGDQRIADGDKLRATPAGAP